jgi:hypothetical protein
MSENKDSKSTLNYCSPHERSDFPPRREMGAIGICVLCVLIVMMPLLPPLRAMGYMFGSEYTFWYAGLLLAFLGVVIPAAFGDWRGAKICAGMFIFLLLGFVIAIFLG